MKLNKQLLPINLYFILSMLTFLLWIPFPEIIHFVGTSSLFYVFLLAIGSNSPHLFVMGIVWICLFFVNFVIWFIIAIKRHQAYPFLIIAGLDLAVSFLTICCKVYSRNSVDIALTIMGFVVRSVYYCWMVYSSIAHLQIIKGDAEREDTTET